MSLLSSQSGRPSQFSSPHYSFHIPQTHSNKIELIPSLQRKMNGELSERGETDKFKTEFRVEDALRKLGGFSRFQLLVTISIVFIEIPVALVAFSPIIVGIPPHAPFSCQSENGSTELIPNELLCSSNCSGEVVSFGPHKSIIQEWTLICEKAWMPDAFASTLMVGSALGTLAMGICSDKFGRKKSFYTIGTLLGFSGVICAVAPHPYFYVVAMFIGGFCAGGSFVAHFNYLMEFLPPEWRQICGGISFWSIGEMLLGLVGYLSPTWRTASWAVSLPAFLIFFSIFVIPESPRWLLVHERTEEAAVVLEQIAEWNSKPPLTSEEVKLLQSTISLERELAEAQKSEVWKRLRNPRLFKLLLIFCFAWFSNAIVYYGLSYNMKNLGGSLYVNLTLLGVVDFFAELSGLYQSNRFGRKSTFVSNLLFAVFILLSLLFVELNFEDEMPWVKIGLSLVGRYFVEASWAIMACFTGESFPTTTRTITLSICSFMGYVGAIVAPQLSAPYIPKAAPYIVFSAISFMSAIASTRIPEMKGKPLQDI